jgi:hypothetical protein
MGRLALRTATAVRTRLVRLAKLAVLAAAVAGLLIVLDLLLLGHRDSEGGGA